MVYQNDLQHVGCVSSGQQRTDDLYNHTSGGTLSDFHKTSESAVRDCSQRKRIMFWNRSKHSSAQEGSPPVPNQILTHQPLRLPFSWRVTWKVIVLSSKRPSTSSTRQESWNFWMFWIFWTCKVVGRRPARCITESILLLECWEFLKLHQWQINANWVLNLPRLERWWRGVFSVPVYYLLEHSLSQYQMWTFHFALHTTFSSGFLYGLLDELELVWDGVNLSSPPTRSTSTCSNDLML